MSKEIANAVQTAFLEATERLAEEGTSLTDLMVDSLKNDPLKTLSALSRFVPAQAQFSVDAQAPSEINMKVSIVPAKAPQDAASPEGLTSSLRVVRARDCIDAKQKG